MGGRGSSSGLHLGGGGSGSHLFHTGGQSSMTGTMTHGGIAGGIIGHAHTTVVGGGGGAGGGGPGRPPILPNGQGSSDVGRDYEREWQDLQASVRRFTDGFSAEAYHQRANFNMDVWRNVLTEAERQAVFDYTGSDYFYMNDTLRGSDYIGGNPQIDNCTSGLDKVSILEDVLLHRGMTGGIDSFAEWTGINVADLRNRDVQRALIGVHLTEKGFMSNGTSPSSSWSGIQLEVYVPRGTHGMYVDPISDNAGEAEVLLQRGSEFIIRDIRTNSSGEITSVVLQLIGQFKR